MYNKTKSSYYNYSEFVENEMPNYDEEDYDID